MKKSTLLIMSLLSLSLLASGCGDNSDDANDSSASASLVADNEVTQTAKSTTKPSAAATSEAPSPEPTVYDGDGNVITKNPDATMPPLDSFPQGKEEGSKIYVNAVGEVQIDYKDGTSEILWTPYKNPNDSEPESETSYDKFSEVPAISADDHTIAVLDASGNVKEYIGSDDKEFADAYAIYFTYTYHSLSTPETAENNLKKQNEVSDNTAKWSDDDIKEIVMEYKNHESDSEEFVSLNIENAAFNESKDFCVIYTTICYNTSASDSTQGVHHTCYLKKIDGKWYKTTDKDSALKSYIESKKLS